MKKVITVIRELKQIESELVRENCGVLSVLLEDEKLYQVAGNFVYTDKNIYVFLNIEDDIYQKIKFGNAGSFTIHRFEGKPDSNGLFTESTYNLLSVTINGIFREVEDKKMIDQIIENYRAKYSNNADPKEYSIDKNLKPVLIDTEEMTAFTEEGN